MIDSSRITEVRRSLGRQLAMYRQAAGYSQHQFAPLTHYGRSTIANVEVGRQNVSRDFWKQSDAILGTGDVLTAQYDELVLLVRQQHRENAQANAVMQPLSNEESYGRTLACSAAAGTVPLTEAATVTSGPVNIYLVDCCKSDGSSVPTRREIFGYFGTGLTAIGLDQALTRWQVGLPRVVHALEITRQTEISGPAALEDIEAVIEHYKQTFRSSPPTELYNEILGVRAHAGAGKMLDSMRTANNRSDLTVAVGWLSNLLAAVTHDLHDRAASLVWCADAERCSREASYPELGGWAALTRVRMSFYSGQSHEAVTHAQWGQQLAPLGTVVHAELVAQEMRAWALIGNSGNVSSTRWRAEEAIAKLPPNTPTQGAFSISLADDPPYTATSLLLLGRHKEAVEATQRVITTFYGSGSDEGRREHPSGFARTYLILALALAGLGKLDEAYAAASMALEAPRLVWPVAVLAGKLDQKLMHDFTNTAEACAYHERYVAAMQQNPS